MLITQANHSIYSWFFESGIRIDDLRNQLHEIRMTKGVWKTLALLALTVCVMQALATLYYVLALRHNLNVFEDGAPICWTLESRRYDSVAAAQAIGRLDLVSFLLTVGGLGLAVFALMGWWLIRREAKDEAREVASDEARKVAQLYFKEGNEKRTNGGGDKQPLRAHMGGMPESGSSFDPSGVSTVGAVEETGASNAKPQRGARRNSRASKKPSSSDG